MNPLMQGRGDAEQGTERQPRPRGDAEQRTLRAFSALSLIVALHPIGAQTVTEWSVETRLTLSYHVADSTLQKLLPTGWISAPSTAATNLGANLTVTFVDRQLALDPSGKPLRTGMSRYIVFVAPAKNPAGETNNIVIAGLSPEGAGAYGVNLMAATSKVERASKTKAEDGGRAEERWTFSAESGEKVELQVAFRRATPVKSHLVSHLRSALHPELTRTYTIDQAVDVVHSLSTPDRLDALRFKAKGPAFAALFDGTETLLAVSSIPWYAREISVP